MSIIKIFATIIILLVLITPSGAQQVKPQFKELTLVTYQPNDSLKKLGVTINQYYHVNSDGILHFIFNDANISFKGNRLRLSYTGLVRDTAYKLSDDVISELNKIFNGRRKLKSYIVLNKLPHGVFLSMPGSFMTYTIFSNVKDQLIFDQEFFGPEMNIVLNALLFSKMAHQITPLGIYHDKVLEATIVKYHVACMCIPATQGTPPACHSCVPAK